MSDWPSERMCVNERDIELLRPNAKLLQKDNNRTLKTSHILNCTRVNETAFNNNNDNVLLFSDLLVSLSRNAMLNFICAYV